MKKRTIAVPILISPPPPKTQGYAAAMADDEAWFKSHPTKMHRTRPYVPGEADPDQPAGTVVDVFRKGAYRARCFRAPKTEGLN